jgi:hypothetical protein
MVSIWFRYGLLGFGRFSGLPIPPCAPHGTHHSPPYYRDAAATEKVTYPSRMGRPIVRLPRQRWPAATRPLSNCYANTYLSFNAFPRVELEGAWPIPSAAKASKLLLFSIIGRRDSIPACLVPQIALEPGGDHAKCNAVAHGGYWRLWEARTQLLLRSYRTLQGCTGPHHAICKPLSRREAAPTGAFIPPPLAQSSQPPLLRLALFKL